MARLFLLCLSTCLLTVITPHTPLSAADSLSRTYLAKLKQNTVYISCTSGTGQRGTGSGWVMEGGIICTNAHVLGYSERQRNKPSQVIVSYNSGTSTEHNSIATVLAVDIAYDLAFLKSETKPKSAPRGLSLTQTRRIHETQPIWIAGFPFGQALAQRGAKPSVTIGTATVSSLKKDPSSDLITSIQVDGDINPGNSGGPIVDSRGNVVGVSVATVVGTAIAFAIPPDLVKSSLQGRVTGCAVLRPSMERDRYTATVRIETADPKQQMKRVRAGWWVAKTPADSMHRPTRKNKLGITQPTHGDKGDGRQSWVTAKQIEPGIWEAEIKNVAFKTDYHYFIMEVSWRSGSSSETVLAFASDKHKFKSALAHGGSGSGTSGGTGTGTANRRPTTRTPSPAGPGKPSDWNKRLNIPKPVTVKAKEVKADSIVITTPPPSEAKLWTETWVPMPGLVDIRSSWDGSKVYACHKDDTKVTILDPAADYKEIGEIQCPRLPKHLYVGEKHLLVSCPESGVLLIVDLKTNQPVTAATLEHAGSTYDPVGCFRFDGNGDYWVTWQERGEAWWDQAITKVSDKGQVSIQTLGKECYNVVGLSSGLLLVQGKYTSSPSATYDILQALGDERFGTRQLSERDFFANSAAVARSYGLNIDANETTISLHQSSGVARLTHDKKHLLLPTKIEGIAVTLICTPDASQVTDLIFGWVIHEDIHKQRFICTSSYKSLQKTEAARYKAHPGLVVRYVDRRSLRTLAMIEVHKPEKARRYSSYSPHPFATFVPGHEDLFIINARRDGDFSIRVDCGPVVLGNTGGKVATKPDTGTDHSPGIIKQAPTSGQVGQKLSYQIQLPPIDGLRPKLKSTVPGMTITSKGLWTWTPQVWQLGAFDVEIVGEMPNGGKVELKKWRIQIKK